MKRSHGLALTLILSSASTFAFAQPKPHGPPPREAVEACASKSAGDACTFEGRHGVAEGTCFQPDESHPLACRPSKPPPDAPGEEG